jgi:AcrR family transcriptional regulator
MEETSKVTEQKILECACSEFMEYGLRGARMQAIAQRAGVNKALIHYYFRTKEKLYTAVLTDIIRKLWQSIGDHIGTISEEDDIEKIFRMIVTTYISVMRSNPNFPRLFIREFADGGNKIPEILDSLISSFGKIPQQILLLLEKGMATGRIKKMDPSQILVNLIGMTLSMFIIQPLYTEIRKRFLNNEVVYNDAFFEERIESIITMTCHGIFVQGGKL